jgi:hypothetical protein
VVATLRLKNILEPVRARVENELGRRILCDIVADQNNSKYTLQIAGSKPGEILILDTAPDDVIAKYMHASLIKHFKAA